MLCGHLMVSHLGIGPMPAIDLRPRVGYLLSLLQPSENSMGREAKCSCYPIADEKKIHRRDRSWSPVCALGSPRNSEKLHHWRPTKLTPGHAGGSLAGHGWSEDQFIHAMDGIRMQINR